MYRAMHALPISELRTRQAEILAQVNREPVMLTHRGVTAGILVSAEMWNEIVDLLEDYEDVVIASERQQRAVAEPEVMRPLSDLRATLQADGLLDD